MKPEELDSLLLDRAVGELRPEVTALLDEHLARDSAAARRAAEFDATLQLARAAVSVRAPVALPPLRAREPASERAPRVGRSFGKEWLHLAAAIIIGLSAGTGVGLKLREPERAPVASAAPEPVPVAERAPSSTRFWSASRRTAELLQPAARRAVASPEFSPPRWLPARAKSLQEDSP